VFQFSHTNLWNLFFQTLNHNQGGVITPAFPKEVELMDNFNPDEPIPRSPHVTLLYDNVHAIIFSARVTRAYILTLDQQID
jgi:hypothetical protein